MNFKPTSEQQLFRDTLREFVKQEVAPIAAEVDQKALFPREAYRKAAELGLLAMTVPEEAGGAGLDWVTYAMAIEELAKGSATLADAIMLNEMLTSMLYEHGTDEQKARYLQRLIEGEILGAFALTEPNAGTDVASIETRASRDGDDWIISGSKMFINSGPLADVAFVTASTDRSLAHRGLTMFLVEKGTPGFSADAPLDLMGQRGLAVSGLSFQDVRVSDSQRLGAEGQAFKMAMQSLDGGRIAIAALSIGIAAAALEESLRYAQQRHQFGQPIANFQLIQAKLADMAMELDAARLLTFRAAAMQDEGVRCTKEAAMAKLFASEMANRVVDEAVQIHGGYGYTRDYAVERYFRDARITKIYEGTNEIQRLVIAKQLLKEYAV